MPYVEYDEVEAICSDCGRVFRSEEALSEHQAEAHSGKEATVRPGAGGSLVKCSLCHQKFRSTAALRDHNARAHTS
jgi:transcription initiation factor TFIIIB Brf1 subunit/transcription initiation factor TFIIB